MAVLEILNTLCLAELGKRLATPAGVVGGAAYPMQGNIFYWETAGARDALYCTGIRFWWPSTYATTIRAELWSGGNSGGVGGTLEATVDVVVGATGALYTATFAARVSMVAWRAYAATIRDISGGRVIHYEGQDPSLSSSARFFSSGQSPGLSCGDIARSDLAVIGTAGNFPGLQYGSATRFFPVDPVLST